MVQHTGDTFLTLTDLDQLTSHSSMKLAFILQLEKSIITTTVTFTRVKLFLNKINKSYHKKLQNCAIDSMVILTYMILYNHMIVIGIDIPTTCETCASVKDFSMTNGTYSMNNFTYESNCYSMFIHCKSDH